MAEMTSSTPPRTYECIHCSSVVPSLYITYKDPSNTSLSLCTTCNRPADEYEASDEMVELLDVLLLKQEVYRHLLRNKAREGRELLLETVRLGVVVVGLDAVVRCIGVPRETDLEVLKLFAQTCGFCLIETTSLLLCISVSAHLLRPRTPPQPNLLLTPLTLFYSAIPLVLTLVISSIVWRNEYGTSPASSSSTSISSPFADIAALFPDISLPPPPPAYSHSPTGILAYIGGFSRAALKSGLAQAGSGQARGWASEALLRKVVGGGSAVVAFSVLLRASKLRTSAILAVAWLLHLVVLHCIDPFLL